jgi:hypothetical protein
MQPSHTAILLVAFACGCHGGVFAKRQSEENCPTDIRKTVPCYPGEDAIFRCPCGPSGNFYGHRPTCWRTWPAPAEVWRDGYCGPTVIEHSSSAPHHPHATPEAIISAPEPTLAPQALPPPGAEPPVTAPPTKSSPQSMPVPFPGLPPLPGQSTQITQPVPRFVAAKSSKRSPSAPAAEQADSPETQLAGTQAMHNPVVAPQGSHEPGQELHIVQPAALEASDAEQSEVKLVATEPIEEDAAALATYEAASAESEQLMNVAPLTVAAPTSRPVPSTFQSRPRVTGFVR